jgi:hypothetical protein
MKINYKHPIHLETCINCEEQFRTHQTGEDLYCWLCVGSDPIRNRKYYLNKKRKLCLEQEKPSTQKSNPVNTVAQSLTLKSTPVLTVDMKNIVKTAKPRKFGLEVTTRGEL